jgi:uncharacterized delta-60 repeat protein
MGHDKGDGPPAGWQADHWRLFDTYNGTTVNNLARLNPNGSLDPTFTGRSLSAFGDIEGIALQPDGKIIITGKFSTYDGTTVNNLARLNPNGSLDSTLNVGMGLQGSVVTFGYCLAVQPDNKIIVGGNFTTYNGTPQNSLVRLNANGSIDASFNIGAGLQLVINNVLKLGSAYGIAVQPDGKILVGGDFNRYNGINVNSIVRLNPDGSMDSAFTDSSLLIPGTDPNVKT